MEVRKFLAIQGLRQKQRRAIQDAEALGMQYSSGLGESADDPIVITGAEFDLAGTIAIFAWLIGRYGTMDVDWRMRIKNALVREGRHIDHYIIQLPSGEEVEHFFDITQSWGKWPR